MRNSSYNHVFLGPKRSSERLSDPQWHLKKKEMKLPALPAKCWSYCHLCSDANAVQDVVQAWGFAWHDYVLLVVRPPSLPLFSLLVLQESISYVLHVSDGSLHPYSNLFHPWSFNRIQQKFTYGSLNRGLDVQVASAWTEEVGQSSASSWVFVNGSNSGGFTATNYCWWMKSGVHQLREREFIPLFTGFYKFIHPPGGVGFQPSVLTLTM